jgi:hypothetical protein
MDICSFGGMGLLQIHSETVEKAVLTNRVISRYFRFLKFHLFESMILLFFTVSHYYWLDTTLCKTVIGNFFYVVYHAVKQPLDIYFYLAP